MRTCIAPITQNINPITITTSNQLTPQITINGITNLNNDNSTAITSIQINGGNKPRTNLKFGRLF